MTKKNELSGSESGSQSESGSNIRETISIRIATSIPNALFSEQSLTRLLAHPVTHEKGSTPRGYRNTAQGWRRFLPPTLGLSAVEFNPNGVAIDFSQAPARNPFRVDEFDRLTQGWTQRARQTLGSEI